MWFSGDAVGLSPTQVRTTDVLGRVRALDLSELLHCLSIKTLPNATLTYNPVRRSSTLISH